VDAVGPEEVRRAGAASAGLVSRTPVLSSRTLGERAGGTIALKAENLQRTGSFKLRGALARLLPLPGGGPGVTTGSAGNHAAALAWAARARGLACEVFMPASAPIAKAEAAAALGAVVRLGGASVVECIAAARERAVESGMVFVHPFDDPLVVAGQGGVGLELVEQVPDLAMVVVPLGGGGLASGLAIAVKSAYPEARVIGVQAAACAPFVAALRGGAPSEAHGAPETIADGIAVKRPGELTLPLVERWLDDVVAVGEDAIAEAMILLLERAKLVVEGAGAAGVAALLSGAARPADRGTTAVVLSGGNVDPRLLAHIARRHEAEVGRTLVLATRIPDRPGALAGLLGVVGGAGANVVDVEHVRDRPDLRLGQTDVRLTLETRGHLHAQQVGAALDDAGYEVRVEG